MKFIGTLTDCVVEIEKTIQRKLSVVECGDIVKLYFRTFKHHKFFEYVFANRGNVYKFNFSILGKDTIEIKQTNIVED